MTLEHIKRAGWYALVVVTFPLWGFGWMYNVLTTALSEPKHQTISKQQVDAIIVRYAHKGYLVANRSKTQLVLVKKKQFSFLLAILGMCLGGIGLVIYILFYLAEKDDVLTIAVTHDQPAKP